MKPEDRRWLVFDGPIDAVWVENLNMVLDDNKRLGLASSENIPLTPNMNVIFEVMDLAVASPATVSRNGFVSVHPTEMGWNHLYMSWKANLPKNVGPD